MRELDRIAEDLFDKIRSRFENVGIGDKEANDTTDPKNARFFNFDYISKDGENFGNITISIVDEVNLKLYFSKNENTLINFIFSIFQIVKLFLKN